MSALGPAVTFASENEFLFAVLGVLAARAEVARARAALAPAAAPVASSNAEQVLSALLGLVHLIEHGGAVVESWASAPSTTPSPTVGGTAPSRPTDVLR